MILKSFLSLKIGIEIWRAEAVCHAFYCFVFFLPPCDLVCATTRNPGYTNWVLHLWLASCWQTRHTLVFASMFLTTTTLEAEECRNYTGCCQPQQVGITSSFFFSFLKGALTQLHISGDKDLWFSSEFSLLRSFLRCICSH